MITSILKIPWDEQRRDRFMLKLQQNNWKVCRELKDSTIFQKYMARIEVDWFGAFLFEFKITPGGWRFVRTHGISDDRCDAIFSHGNNPGVLPFYNWLNPCGERVYRVLHIRHI